jgi:hypothetical protein
MRAWHFSNSDCTLEYDDNRKILLGKSLSVKCKPILCEQGLHGSVKIIDALNYAKGPVIWRVDITGCVVKGNDKIVGQKRKAIAGGIDISDTLREFARWCALRVIHLWDAPEIVIEYFKTGDKNLRAAASDAATAAAMYAASDAATAAAMYEATAAARVAAMYEATAAARVAAMYEATAAARVAAMYAATAAARAEYNKKLTSMVNKLLKYKERNQ